MGARGGGGGVSLGGVSSRRGRGTSVRVSANLDEDGNPLGRDTTFGMREKMLKEKEERNTDSFWARLSHSFPPPVPTHHPAAGQARPAPRLAPPSRGHYFKPPTTNIRPTTAYTTCTPTTSVKPRVPVQPERQSRRYGGIMFRRWTPSRYDAPSRTCIYNVAMALDAGRME